MKAAPGPRQVRDAAKLAVTSEAGTVHRRLDELATFFAPGDVLVVNDAGTLPASIGVRTRTGDALELRLTEPLIDGRTKVIAFGEGDYRVDTNERIAPPLLANGDHLFGDDGLRVEVEAVDARFPRLLSVAFVTTGEDAISHLFRRGRPVQYSHTRRQLNLWDVTTTFAGVPWAVEAPSASLPLSHRILTTLRERGVIVTSVTHAAGLSATGDPTADSRLPFPERFRIEEGAAAILRQAHGRRRIVASGTSVVRAIEGSFRCHDGRMLAGEGVTDLRIDGSFGPQVVTAILSGFHDRGGSHFELMQAFTSPTRLEEAYAEAEEAGYASHEFGDAHLVARDLVKGGGLAA
jgi:S-adenosylmethionine:tRNA ribosyltransferase-isomerase